MEENDLISHLKKAHRQPPNAEWLFETRRKLFAEQVELPRASTLIFPLFAKVFQLFAARPVMAFGSAAIVFCVTSFAGAAVFARKASPTSSLYGFKLAIERAEGSLAFTEEQKAAYGFSLAGERIAELTKLHAGTEAHEAQGALITEALTRYTAALRTSTNAVQRMQREGKKELARQNAEKLKGLIHTSSVILAVLDTESTSSSLLVLENARALSHEAEAATMEILGESTEDTLPTDTEALPSSGVFPSESSTRVFVAPILSPSPAAAYPSTLPNVVEDENQGE